MFNKLLRRRNQQSTCFHEWKLVDFHMVYLNALTSVESNEVYTLGCNQCKTTRIVDEYTYKQLLDLGLVK